MRVGKLRHRIEIYKNIQTQNEYGESELKSELIATLWASINTIKSDEEYISQKEQSILTHKIEIRYVKNIEESYLSNLKIEFLT